MATWPLIGNNPGMRGLLPSGFSYVKEVISVLKGTITVHSCYPAGPDACTRYWTDQDKSLPAFMPVERGK